MSAYASMKDAIEVFTHYIAKELGVRSELGAWSAHGSFRQNVSIKKMTLSEAIAFIKPAFKPSVSPQRWADLGCGSGIFCEAVASRLASGSQILGLDKERQPMKTFTNNVVQIQYRNGDFTQYEFDTMYDGFMLGNSIHYVENKAEILKKLMKQLTPSGRILVIEYDRSDANEWVPFPIPFLELESICASENIGVITKLNERESSYGSQMYLCEIQHF